MTPYKPSKIKLKVIAFKGAKPVIKTYRVKYSAHYANFYDYKGKPQGDLNLNLFTATLKKKSEWKAIGSTQMVFIKPIY